MPLDPSLFFRGAELQMANDQMNRQTMDKFFTTLAQSRQNQMPDIEKEAMAGLYTIEAGGVPTPKQQASLKVWQKLRQSEQMFDPATQSVIPKYNMSVFGVVPGELPTQQGYEAAFNPESLSPAMTMQTGQNLPVVNDLGGELMIPVGDNYPEVSQLTQGQRDAARGIPMPSNPKQAQTAYEANVDIAKKAAEADIGASGKKAEAYAAEKGTEAAKSEERIKGLTDLASSMGGLIQLAEEAPSGAIESTAAWATNKLGRPSKAAIAGAKLESAGAITGLQSRVAFLKGQGTITDAEAKTAMAFLPDPTDSKEVKIAKIGQAREYIMSLIENRAVKFVDQNSNMPGFKYLGTE